MAHDAEALLIQPFRDVVAVGTTAINNAAAHVSGASHRSADPDHVDHMSAAAQAVVREGERALKRVQAVWDDHVEKHGDEFRQTMMQQASIEQRRLHLEDLLWDFDDFAQPETFDGGKFSALQSATKSLALDIVETARRLRLGSSKLPEIPQGGFPPLPPLPTRSATHYARSSRPPSARSHHTVLRAGPTPPSSPKTVPVLARPYDLTLDASVGSNRVIDSPSSPSTTYTRTSVMSNTSSINSSSAPMGSIDSFASTDENIDVSSELIPSSPPLRQPSIANSEQSLMGLEDLLRESSWLSEPQKGRPAYPRSPDCKIGEGSTYHRLKGFCPGAARFRKDGNWSSIKFSTEFEYGGGGIGAGGGDLLRASDGIVVPLQYEMTKVGSCGECGYAHDLDEVEADKSNKVQSVLTSECGARYRLRLLFKSHLKQGSSSEVHYGCLWCVQAGTTVREGDATVFRCADDLVHHLARHPQPLPPVRGLEVLYGRVPDSAPHDFDLHLPDSPIPVPMPENALKLPTATGAREHYRRPGRGKLERPPKYEGEMLEFMEGARIVGVIIPEKWGGKWCLGRHDGMFGAFSAKAIDLRPPQQSEIPSGGESGMSVTTKWKFSPPNGVGVPWLSFGKGEVITNVQSLYADYWCWSGTSSKGKTGVFPQSHINLETLKRQESAVKKRQSRGRSFFGYRSTASAEAAPKETPVLEAR